MKLHREHSINQDAVETLSQAFAVLQTKEDVQHFLQDLCTPAELQAMADRWLVVEPLKQGDSYRQIHEKTGVSVTTVGRVARSINFGEGGYDLAYQRVKDNESITK